LVRAWVNRIGGWRRRAPRISRQEALAAIPVRNGQVRWEVNGREEVVLLIPRRQDRLGRLLNRIFAAPEHRQIVLDEIGSEVWQLCDGEHTVDEIIRTLASRHRLSRREVELSLTLYLQQLARRRLIGLMVRR